MKKAQLKELIKQSMSEFNDPEYLDLMKKADDTGRGYAERDKFRNQAYDLKRGAMTPDEERMVSDYEEEEANKYALDSENPLEEGDSDDLRSRLAALEEAKDMLGQVVEIISYALKGTTHQRHAEAYILSHLNDWIDDSGYNMGIQQYIDALIGGDDDEESLDEMISRVDSIVESYNSKVVNKKKATPNSRIIKEDEELRSFFSSFITPDNEPNPQLVSKVKTMLDSYEVSELEEGIDTFGEALIEYYNDLDQHWPGAPSGMANDLWDTKLLAVVKAYKKGTLDLKKAVSRFRRILSDEKNYIG